MKKYQYILIYFLPFFAFGLLLYLFTDKKPLVSVVMPTYNRVNLLPRSIDSIRNQTYQNFEFIIVDDGSTDGTNELLKSYAQLDKRIRILTNPTNKGISYSRNRGTDAAKGKYVAIMDSDDYSLPTRFEKHVKYLEEHDDVVVLNALYIEMGKEQNGTNNWVPPDRFNIIFHLKNYFTNIAFFRTDFVRKHNIRYNEKTISSEDYDFWAQIFMKGGKFAMLNEHLFNLRRHRTNSKEYYKQISVHSRKTSNRLLRAAGVPSPEKLATDCDRISALLKTYEEKENYEKTKTLYQKAYDLFKKKEEQPIDLYTFKLTHTRLCNSRNVPKYAFYLKHLDFVDYLEKTDEENIFERTKNKEKYTLIKNEKNKHFTFKNPNFDIEIYVRQRDRSLALKEVIKTPFYKKIIPWIKDIF